MNVISVMSMLALMTRSGDDCHGLPPPSFVHRKIRFFNVRGRNHFEITLGTVLVLKYRKNINILDIIAVLIANLVC